MKTKSFRLRNNFLPRILFCSSSALLVLFGILTIVSPVASTVNAEGETGNATGSNLTITTNKTINATIHPTDEGIISIIKDTVVGNTDSSNGYELYISTNSDSVNDIYLNGNTTNSLNTQKITATAGTYTAPVALSFGNGATWGYAVAGLDNFDAAYDEENPSSASKFAAVPTSNNKQLIHNSSTAAVDDEIDIYYGIKANTNLEPGVYKTEILYTAIAKQASRTPKAILGDNGNLNLVYDSSTYTVGDTYTDNLGSTEIAGVFDIPESGNLEEYTSLVGIGDTRDDVLSVNFDTSFQDYTPYSTSYWFDWLTNAHSFTNTENLNTSQVRSMVHMFDGVGRGDNIATVDLGNIKSWDVSNVIATIGMFQSFGYSTANWTLDLSGWNFANLMTMDSMFANAGFNSESMTLILSDWNAPKLVNMSMAFDDTAEHAQSMNIDVSGWTLGSLQNTQDAFYEAGRYVDSFSLTGLSDWDMSTVTNLTTMFQQTGANVDDFELEIKNWDLSSATNLSRLFDNTGYNSTTWTMDVSGWTFCDNANLSYLFNYAGFGVSGATDWTIDVTGWTFGNNPNLEYAFVSTGYEYDTWTMIGASTWNVSAISNFDSFFDHAGYNASSWSIGDLSGWNTSNATSMNGTFEDAGFHAGTNFTIGNISGWDVQQVTGHSNFMTTNSAEVPPHGVVQPNWQ